MEGIAIVPVLTFFTAFQSVLVGDISFVFAFPAVIKFSFYTYVMVDSCLLCLGYAWAGEASFEQGMVRLLSKIILLCPINILYLSFHTHHHK